MKASTPPRTDNCTTGYRHREVEPIEVLMESLLYFLSTLEFHPRLLNVRIAREALRNVHQFWQPLPQGLK
jgi:hypothetical protein